MISSFPTKKPYNPGGYKSFQFIPAYQVDRFPAIVNGSATAALTFVGSAKLLDGYATTETLGFNEEPVTDNPNGTFYDLTVSGLAPGDKPELTAIMNDMSDIRYIVIALDTLGVKRLIGSITSPLDFYATFNSGAARLEMKGYTFKFTGESIMRAPAYPW